jgi:hypothetical protein
MSKPEGEVRSKFLKPSLFEALKQDLTDLQSVEPGSRTPKEVIEELMPLIQGSRDRGHSWQRIAGFFQKYLPDLTVGSLRKIAFELDPSLKGTVKGVSPAQASSSVLPDFQGNDNEDESEDADEDEDIEDSDDEDVWPPPSPVVDEDEDEETESEEEEISITPGRRVKS